MKRTTLKNLEKEMKAEGNTGYVLVRLPNDGFDTFVQIGYFKIFAEKNNVSYEKTNVEFKKYTGWE